MPSARHRQIRTARMGRLTPRAMRIRRGVVPGIGEFGGTAALLVVMFGMPDPSTVVCVPAVRVGTSVPGVHVDKLR